MFYSSHYKALISRIAVWGIENSGKTETLKGILSLLPDRVTRGNWLDYEGIPDDDRELFLEYVPVRLGEIKGVKAMMELFAPPRPLVNDGTWLSLASDPDGVLLTVDSDLARLSENLKWLDSLKDRLGGSGKFLQKVPVVCQLNKRDLNDALPVDVLERAINLRTAPFIETVASDRLGLHEVLRGLTKLMLRHVSDSLDLP